MHRAAFLLVWAFVSLPLLAQEDAKPLTPEEAAGKIDEKVTVQMEVKSTGGSNTSRYLNSMANYRDRKNFTIYIPGAALAAFKRAQIDDPADYYKAKTIQVTGIVSLFRGQVQIKVDNPDQIKIVESETEEPKTKLSAKSVKGKSGKGK